MPTLETPSELTESLADQAGIYGGCNGQAYGNTIDCTGTFCRICWTADITNRIREAVKTERLLDEVTALRERRP